MSKVAIVIPARHHSTRLPFKVLLQATGKTLLQHTYEMAKAADLGPIFIATDSTEICAAVEKFGGIPILTGDHPSGTARVAWVTRTHLTKYPDITQIINVQADEPELDHRNLVRLLPALDHNDVATFAAEITSREEFERPSVVKVVRDFKDNALYFSRACIPWSQSLLPQSSSVSCALRHVGVYAYTTDFLRLVYEFPELYQQSLLSRLESLEQIAWLQNGHSVNVVLISNPHVGIDTAEDYEQFCTRYREQTGGQDNNNY